MIDLLTISCGEPFTELRLAIGRGRGKRKDWLGEGGEEALRRAAGVGVLDLT